MHTGSCVRTNPCVKTPYIWSILSIYLKIVYATRNKLRFTFFVKYVEKDYILELRMFRK